MADSVLNKATQFFWHLFCLNLIFFASNTPLMIILLFVVFHWITLPLYFMALFLFTISVQAMLLTLKRVLQTEELSILRQYIIAYQETFKHSKKFLLTYLICAIILLIGYVNIGLMPINQTLFTSTYLILLVLLYVHFIFGLLIQTHFIMDIKGTWKLGLYCISKHPLLSMLIFIKTLVVGFMIQVIPALLLLGIIPLLGYSIFKMTEQTFEKLKVVLIEKHEALKTE